MDLTAASSIAAKIIPIVVSLYCSLMLGSIRVCPWERAVAHRAGDRAVPFPYWRDVLVWFLVGNIAAILTPQLKYPSTNFLHYV